MNGDTWTLPGPTLAYLAGIERAGSPHAAADDHYHVIVEGVMTNQWSMSVSVLWRSFVSRVCVLPYEYRSIL